MRISLAKFILDIRLCPIASRERQPGDADFTIGPELEGEAKHWLLSASLCGSAERTIVVAVRMHATGGFSPVATADDKRLFVGAENTLACFDVSRREQCWLRQEVGDMIHAVFCEDGDLLVVGEHYVERITSAGSRRWRTNTDLLTHYELGEGTLHLRFADDAAVVLDTSTGEENS